MGFFWVLFACCLLTPVIMLLAGWMMWKHCPREINGLLGYRTARSMKNQDTWRFAHAYCGRLWWRGGWVLLLLSALGMLPFMHSSGDPLGTACIVFCLGQAALLVLSIFPTERALRRTFDDEGQRR